MEKSIYSAISKVHLFFYSINPQTNTYELLLIKIGNSTSYKTIQTEVFPFDNAPTFAISRELTNTIGNLFLKTSLEKIIKKEKLTSSDALCLKKESLTFKLWENHSYLEWLNVISQNIIQYDEIEKEVIYYLELPYIFVDFLNNSLNELGINIKFIYQSNENLNTISIDDEVKYLYNKVSFDKMISHIENSQLIMKNDKCDYYIVLACKKKGNDQVGFFHFPALFQGLYRKNNEKWIYLVASSDPLPSEELLNRAKCLIIPGSDLSVYNDYDFLRKTEAFLNKLIDDMVFHNKYQNLKLLGICFGMEIFISSLGGKISNMGKGIFQRYPEDIVLDDSFWELNFVKKTNLPTKKTLRLCEAHGDFIDEYPEKYGFKLMGTSASCKCEILVDKNEKIFMVQGHPEYFSPFNFNRIGKIFLLRSGKNPTDEEVIQFIEKELNQPQCQNININEWRAICYSFIK